SPRPVGPPSPPPQEDYVRNFLTLGLALLLATPCFGASLRKQCNQQCLDEITQCVFAHNGKKRAKCTIQIKAQCRREVIQVCLPTTTTTTTTTTTSTTTTTIPSRFAPYSGRWQFTGYIAIDTCTTPPNGLRDNVTITITVGGGAQATVDSVPGLVCTGEFSD